MWKDKETNVKMVTWKMLFNHKQAESAEQLQL